MHLRSSCTTLRTSSAIFEVVTSVCHVAFGATLSLPGEEAGNLPLPELTDATYLAKLPRLQTLSLSGTTSVFRVHELQTLQHLHVQSDTALDVMPLSSLPQLSRLWLVTA